MRLKVKKTITTLFVFAAFTTIILHVLISGKSQELGGGDLPVLHRRAAGLSAVASLRNGILDGVKVATPGYNPQPRSPQAPGQNDNIWHPGKESKGGIREMAWANDIPSLSDDDSQTAQNASETEFQLKLIERELNQFALQLQKTQQQLPDDVNEQLNNVKSVLPNKIYPADNQSKLTSINPNILKSRQNLTIVVKEGLKFIPLAAETAAKLQQPSPPVAETNFRKTELNDIFIAVKTTGRYHKSRLGILLDTWVTQASQQTYFFTDVTDEEYRIRTNGHLVNTNCSAQHSRQALCCKTSIIYDRFLKSGKRWFCGVDDDNYLNVQQLLALLKDYKHEQDVYLGRASLSHPIEAMDRENQMKRSEFWFATGGAGFCISRSLALKMSPYASGGTFKSVCNRIRLPDDVSIGFIIEILLKHPLTKINRFNSHLQSLRSIKPDHLSQQITLSYGINDKRTNVIDLPQGAFSQKEDPTRFKSLHCLLFPTSGSCPLR